METCSQAFKERGFDLKKTHLKDLAKRKKAVALVNIIYRICVSMGMHVHRKVQKSNTRHHGRTANSFCRKGIDTIRQAFRAAQWLPEGMLSRIKTLLRWITIQTAHFQLIEMAG